MNNSMDFFMYVISDVSYEQFLFFNYSTDFFCSISGISYLFFKNFQKKTIGLFICSMLLFELINENNKCIINITRYKIRREKRVSITFKCSFNLFDVMSFLCNKYSLEDTKGYAINVDYTKKSKLISFKIDRLVSFSETIINKRLFLKYFEFANQVITFNLYNSSFKDIFFLRSSLSYLGLLLL